MKPLSLVGITFTLLLTGRIWGGLDIRRVLAHEGKTYDP